MTSTSVQLIEHGSSPFDQIMELDTDSTPIWRARRLMSLMGYPRWSDFQRVISRAISAAENTGMDVEGSFRRSPDTSNTGQGARPRDDYKLIREAAYLVALNGDPNKAEVAGAQRYFVVQARKQEIAESAPASSQSPVAIPAQPELDRIAIARAQIELLSLAVSSDLLDRPWAATKTLIITARALGEEPELPEGLKPYYVPDFLKDMGLTGKEIASEQSWFGKRVKAYAEDQGIEVPELRPRDLPDGTIRETRAWRREHLPLFNAVWDRYYAEKYARPMFLELGAA